MGTDRNNSNVMENVEDARSHKFDEAKSQDNSSDKQSKTQEKKSTGSNVQSRSSDVSQGTIEKENLYDNKARDKPQQGRTTAL